MSIPKHVAIIMDGNGRWAQKRALPRQAGHKKGVDTLKNIAKKAGEIGILNLTVYAFSTENWNRPDEEVDFLFNLFQNTIQNEFDELKQNDITIRVLGRRNALPENLLEEIEIMEEDTSEKKGMNLNIAFDYGGRAEIVDAFKKIVEENNEEVIKNFTEEDFADYLYLPSLPAVELMIRTGGEKRLSNFLLWELAYSELYFTEKFWPDFTGEDFEEAVEEFKNRERRFGSLKEVGDKDAPQKGY